MNRDGESEEVDTSNWITMQNEFAKQVQTTGLGCVNCLDELKFIGGLDISYRIGSNKEACVSLVILKYPSLEQVFAHSSHIEMTQPYVSGFLGFREVNHFKAILDEVRNTNFLYFPQVVLVDGNGILHVRKFGSASHFGVECDVPTIGVAKNLLSIPEFEIFRDETHKRLIENLNEVNRMFPIKTNTDEVLGMAILTGEATKKPIYVSVGHRINLDTAVEIVLHCSRFRVPEPIRLADILSRKELRNKYPTE